jgi:phage tail-like protein
LTTDIVHQLRVEKDGLVLQTVTIDKDEFVIGRNDDCDLTLPDPIHYVSRLHAHITRTADSYTIKDLSTHGTSVQNQKLSHDAPYTLESGDVIEIGSYRLTYERSGVPSLDTHESTAPHTETEVTIGPEVAPSWGLNGQNGRYQPPPGLYKDHSRYLQYLPGIYHSHYTIRFLALLESLLAPIEWTIENFDLFLDPQTAPTYFLDWLGNWFGLTFDGSWSEEKQRILLQEAHTLYKMRGTAWALSRLLHIYTEVQPEIIDEAEQLEAHTFWVKLPLPESKRQRSHIEQLIDAHKPAHTRYRLVFTGKES